MRSVVTLTFALMLSTSIAFAQNNEAEVEQVGSLNSATVTQSSSANYTGVWQGLEGASAASATATVTQAGESGTVYVVQGRHSAGSVDGSQATINQAGVGNLAYSIQGAAGSDNGSTAVIDQEEASGGNDAYTFQGHGATNVSVDNYASILQSSGTGNFAQISQAAEVYSGSNIYAEGNNARIEQNGDQNEARINQGVAVEWDVRFDGGTVLNNTGLIVQEGSGNDARLNQGIDGASASNSQAWIFQYSDGNIATLSQSGSANTATITQE